LERIYDIDGRARKGQKIRVMINDYFGHNLNGMQCLDIGCSIGVISSVLAENFHIIIGLDIDSPSVFWAQKNYVRTNSSFIIADGMQVPFSAGIFDVIICAQCYEHVADANRLSDEVYRLLKPGGVCMFSGPNRLAIIEDHYQMPFLSWLPRPLADLYLQLAKRGQVYDVHPMTFWELRDLWKKFKIHDYTIKMLREPMKYMMENEVNGISWLKYLPDWSLQILLVFAPNYNWILQKPDKDSVLPGR
jgi:2-polyprenyl-3-methyl-5-hydroxy-6-metoxy-1,4-benzoquinol methylase